MALSAATFMFWSLFGSYILPSSFIRANSFFFLSGTSAVLQCSNCGMSMCPWSCYTPCCASWDMTWCKEEMAVLEKFSATNLIIFDKTGTLDNWQTCAMKQLTRCFLEMESAKFRVLVPF